MKVHVTELKVGDRLIAATFNSFGLHILSENTVLDEGDISKLLLHRVEYVDVADWTTDGRPAGKADRTDRDAEPSAAAAFDNAVRDFHGIYELVRQKGVIGSDDVDSTVQTLIAPLRSERDLMQVLLNAVSQDEYTYRHSVQVGSVSYYIAQWLGMPEADCVRIGTSGLLHDIGKTEIPDSILNKTEALTEDEFALIRKHPEYGYELIRRSFDDEWYAIAALQHHERMDGSGHPHGLAGEAIHPVARIVAVADVYSAMISDRVYGKKKHLLEVLRELHEMSFAKLDPRVVQVFLRNMMPGFIGKSVRLTDGRIGRIAMVYEHDWFSPLMQVGDEFIDLSQQKDLKIAEFAV